MVSHLVFCFFLYRSFLQSGACFNTIWCPCHLKCSHTFSSDKQNFIVGLFVTISLFHNLVFLVSLSLYPFHMMIFHCLDATETLDTAEEMELEGLGQSFSLCLMASIIWSFIFLALDLVHVSAEYGPYTSKYTKSKAESIWFWYNTDTNLSFGHLHTPR